MKFKAIIIAFVALLLGSTTVVAGKIADNSRCQNDFRQSSAHDARDCIFTVKLNKEIGRCSLTRSSCDMGKKDVSQSYGTSIVWELYAISDNKYNVWVCSDGIAVGGSSKPGGC